MYLKKPIGIFEPEGEIGSIRGKECICKEYSGKGLLIDYSIERNNFNESWHYEYYENDLIKCITYSINKKLVCKHAFLYEYY
ncbi:MAG: hypothetical protein GX587_08045 [Bacteroidales bacterium]|nr:hypothetical protein [Bacteroidales bacterium]